MDITPIISEEQRVIKGYGKGYFKLNKDQIIYGNIIVTKNDAVKWDFISSFSDLQTDSFDQLESLNEKVDILLLGCGNKHQIAPNNLNIFLKTKGYNLEIMTTDAACRTYNVLLSEGREVACCLIKM